MKFLYRLYLKYRERSARKRLDRKLAKRKAYRLIQSDRSKRAYWTKRFEEVHACLECVAGWAV